MARPFFAAPGGSQNQLMQQGYAIVGVITDFSNATNPNTYLGERLWDVAHVGHEVVRSQFHR